MQFNFTVENKILTPNDGEYTVIADNSDYSVSFSFDEEWNGKTKTVRFINGKEYVDVILPENNRVGIPLQVMSPPLISVGVYAGTLCTTSPASIKCRVSILTPDGTPKEPCEDVYGQLIGQYDEMKNALGKMNGELDAISSSEYKRIAAEEERQSNEAERQLLYDKLKETDSAFSNAYIMNITGTSAELTVTAEHCTPGEKAMEFYITGEFSETIPDGGKTPESPSLVGFATMSRVSFDNFSQSYRNDKPVIALPGGLTDIFDMKNGQFIHNIGIVQFHALDGEIYLFDTVRGTYGKRYSVTRIESTSGANVFKDNTDAYPYGKEGMTAFSPYFNVTDSPDGCEHGYMYNGQTHCFGYGEKSGSDAEAIIQFYQFVKSLYDSGTPLTVYYEYSEPFVEQITKLDTEFSSSSITVNTRRNPFVLKYRADINSLINGLQTQINELAASLVAMAEGGEV